MMTDTGKFYTNYRFEYSNENVVVATSSFQDVPTNKKPLINLTMNGILRPSEEKVYEIKMIFDGDVPKKDKLAQAYGTFVLCKGVYNAKKIIKTAWDEERSILKIIIDLKRQKVRLKRPAQFSFSIQIDDNPSCKVKAIGKTVLSTLRPCPKGYFCSVQGSCSTSNQGCTLNGTCATITTTV